MYWKLASADNFDLATTTTAGTTNSITASVSAGSQYHFAVAAGNVHGPGPLGATLPIWAASRPAAPTGLTAGAATTTTLTFSWTPPTDTGGLAITAYEVSKSDVGGVFFLPMTPTVSTTSYTATGLTSGTTYGFSVAAINAVGTGAPSGTGFFMTTASS